MVSSAARTNRHQIAILIILFLTGGAGAQQNTTIIGPSNVALQDGADALRAGDAEKGVKLTLLGLSQANSAQERQTANSNLCAGYAMLGHYELGLPYCDNALAENDRHWRARSNRALIYIKLKRFAEADEDLNVAEEISPNAGTLRAVRRMYLDATDPVSPSIVIDDRRSTEEEVSSDD